MSTYSTLAALVVACALAVPAGASDIVTINAIDRGNVADDGNSFEEDDTYITGRLEDIFSPGGTFRSYFVFDLSGIDAPIIGMTLSLFSPANGANSPQSFEVLGLFDFAGDPEALLVEPGGTGTFNDLGTGPQYGMYTLTSEDLDAYVHIDLSQDAIDKANDVAGTATFSELFAIGGSLLSLADPQGQDEFFFSQTFGMPDDWVQLSIETVPAPGGLAVLMLAGLRARRRR